MKHTWEDQFRKGELTGSEIYFGNFRLAVHHWVGCGDVWFASCYGVIDRRTLDSTSLPEAKNEGKTMLQMILEEAIEAIRK